MERIPDGEALFDPRPVSVVWGAFVTTLAVARESVKPPRSPDRMILFGEGAARKAIYEFTAHYHLESRTRLDGNRREGDYPTATAERNTELLLPAGSLSQ